MKMLLFVSLLFIVRSVHAEYVLPYPSYMPGNKLYNLTRMIDKIENYWYFGPIAQTKYHLKLSDKYLVEAKTLFEYEQYLLAVDALSRSDSQFSALSASKIVREAAQKHREVLEALLSAVPSEFIWAPEKTAPTTLDIKGLLLRALTLRK